MKGDVLISPFFNGELVGINYPPFPKADIGGLT